LTLKPSCGKVLYLLGFAVFNFNCNNLATNEHELTQGIKNRVEGRG